MFQILLSVSVFLGLALTSSAHASSFFVKEAIAVGVSKEEAQVVTELVRSGVGAVPGHTENLEAAGADFILQPKLLKLGSSYSLTLEKIRANKIVFSSALRADKVEELDTVATRLARAVIEERNLTADTRVSEVTNNEKVAGTNRRDTVKRWLLGFGPAGLAGLKQSSNKTHFAFGYEWEIPASNAAVKVVYEGVSNFSFWGIDGSYFFNDRDISPFLHATAAYGWSKVEEEFGETSAGFVLGAGGGYRFFRTSSINLEVALSYNVLMASNRQGVPSEGNFRVGLYF